MRHFLKRSSYSSGLISSTRWPTAKVITESSDSKWVSFLENGPGSASVRSRATEGFSAMTNVFTRNTIANASYDAEARN